MAFSTKKYCLHVEGHRLSRRCLTCNIGLPHNAQGHTSLTGIAAKKSSVTVPLFIIYISVSRWNPTDVSFIHNIKRGLNVNLSTCQHHWAQIQVSPIALNMIHNVDTCLWTVHPRFFVNAGERSSRDFRMSSLLLETGPTVILDEKLHTNLRQFTRMFVLSLPNGFLGVERELRCVVLHCVVLCSVVLCCAPLLLCCAPLCCAVLRCVVPVVVSCSIVLCYGPLCCIPLCCAPLCYHEKVHFWFTYEYRGTLLWSSCGVTDGVITMKIFFLA